MQNDNNDNENKIKQNSSPLDGAKNEQFTKEELLDKIKQKASNASDDEIVVNNRSQSTPNITNTRGSNEQRIVNTRAKSEKNLQTTNAPNIVNTRAKNEQIEQNITNTRKSESEFDTTNVKNTRQQQPFNEPKPQVTINNTRAKSENFDTSNINNTRNENFDTRNVNNTRNESFDTSNVNNTRASTPNVEQDENLSNIKNTRAKPSEFDTSSVINTRATPTNIVNTRATENSNIMPTEQSASKPIRHHSETKQFQPTVDEDFIDFVNKALSNQNQNKNVFTMADFNLPQIDFSAFGLPDASNIQVPPSTQGNEQNYPINNLEEQEQLNKTEQQFNLPPKRPRAQIEEEQPTQNASEQEVEKTQATQEEQVAQQIKLPPRRPSPQETQEQVEQVATDKQQIQQPSVAEDLPEELPEELPNQVEQVTQFEEPEIPTSVEQVEPVQEQEPAKPLDKNASLDDLFGLGGTASAVNISTATIPEAEQKDILALIDTSLNENVAAVLASQNASDLSVLVDGVAEDLVVAKVRHGRKLWILLLLLLLGITVLFACCYDSWFGKTPNEEEAKGLTLTIVPSSGEEGSLDAEYIFFPGSTIIFKDNVNIGSERFRYEEQPDGSLKQYENNAFAFRFRFYVEFVDEGPQGARPEHNEIISHVIIPEDVSTKFRIAPNEAGEDTVNPFSYDGSWIYYYGIIYPGEKYIAFCSGISMYQSIANDYQGRNFNVIMEYETVVPDGDIAKVLEDVPDAPTSWASQITSEYQAYYAG